MATASDTLRTPTEQPTRRAALGALATGVLGSSIAAAGAIAADEAYPDADLLQAARRWREAGRIWLQDPDEDVSDAAHAEFERLAASITALPARTAAGVAAKLRVALLHSGVMGDAEALLLGYGACSAGVFDEPSQLLTWEAIETLERLASGRA